MHLYQSGDVVLLPFPYQENDSNGNYQFKVRPGLILELKGKLVYAVIQITTKNKSDTHKGIWVKASSDRGKLMGLTKDSYINLEIIQDINESEIIRTIGYIDDDLMDQIELLLSM